MKQENETRWNSLFTCLESIQENYNDIQNILAERGQLYHIAPIGLPLLNQLIEFLEIFKTATAVLECNKTPTFHLVAQWRAVMIKACEIVDAVDSDDSDIDLDEMKNLKRRIETIIKEKFELSPYHVAATLLDPYQMHMLDKYYLKRKVDIFARQLITSMMSGIQDCTVVRDEGQGNLAIADIELTRLNKKRRLSAFELVKQFIIDDSEPEFDD